MTSRRRLALALALSVVAHVVTLTDMEWTWPWHDDSGDEVLSQKPADSLKRVSLAFAQAKPVSQWPVVYLLKPETLVEASKPEPKPEPQPVTKKPVANAAPPAPEPVAENPSETAPEIADTLAKADDQANPVVPDVIEPAPRFPVQITALQRASYYGFELKLTQQWFMEGFRYAIINDASKFGFTATLSSEGSISPDGLMPEHYRLLLNNTLKQYADFDRNSGLVTHGKAGQQRTVPITPDFQDMASLPYHVAVSYGGEKEKRLMVTTGSSVYEIALNIVSEDQLKLPGGLLRTIHLTGTRVRSDGTRQSGYDIWLAPSLRNFPVKFRGPDSKGNILEMSVLTVMFDGQAVFGKDVVFVPITPDDAELPEGILPDIIDATPLAE